MENSLPAFGLPSAPTVTGSGGGGSDARKFADLNLLLVSRSSVWLDAVYAATRKLGRGDVFACDARDAVRRLAGTSSHYSHLLVDRNDDGGLLDELADLATEVAAPDTDMFVLGKKDTKHPRMRVISQATSRSVVKALTASSPPRRGPDMDLNELRAALSGTMIETRYQPIVRISDRHPVGLEALARLNHPQQGTLSPDRFVPQIEDGGLGAQLTDLVSALAFADLAGPALTNRGLRMSVNFPLDVLLNTDALDRLEQQRVDAGIAADRIIIELTESRPVDDFRTLGRSLERLRNQGYGAAIDDVGPAVPRLAPLLDLPFTSLKLDKDMVQRVDASEKVKQFLATTIVQAKAHGLTIVAEGVETEETWDQMRQLGADEVQGFLVARPLPVAAVPVWWDAWVSKADTGG
jgi:EAL domain-containing protein (putative c-di-GMP-specific phosphodiesterase class I)